MSGLRKPFFYVAAALLVMVLLIETGTALSVALLGSAQQAVGWGIPALSLLDGQLVLTVILMALPLIVPERVTGRIQGIITLIVSMLLLILGLITAFTALSLLMLLVALLLAVPFGPIAYAGMGYGSFKTGAAATTLGLVLLSKLASGGFLVAAHQRFMQNKGLVLMIATSLLASVMLSFLHGIVNVFLVSVTDLIGAVIIAVVAVVWSAVSLFFSIISIRRAVL